MKKPETLLLLLLLCGFAAPAQQVVSGLYTGQLYNDTLKQTQNYELALSEYRGKISGWAYVTFTANDTFYYGIRRIKGVHSGNQIILEDEEHVANNFPESPAKKVKRTYTFNLSATADTVRSMDGRWQTNRTKTYVSIPGSASLNRTPDSSGSALVAHLKELGWKGDTQDPPKAVVATAKPKEEKPAATKNQKTVVPATAPPVATAIAPAVPAVIPYEQRKAGPPQVVAVSSSDSLVLSFYDNGVVDGDVISVYINGEQVLANAKLTEQAAKKTISIKNIAAGDVTLTLVAETLGSLPPNTGLLVVRDGEVRHQIRFSADLQTNASIVFKKK